ncbi:MAG: hypothetical protein HYT65_02660 [Candidatus Yanofskybacteria bacterium]|nr:hypothetical protein [Candidatus Yanofskybacteria bacterium]
MEKTSFFNLINEIGRTAKQEKWAAVYDKQTDYFYWKKPKLSKDSRLLRISNETSVYLNPRNKKAEGIMIEYLADNFMEHNEGFSEFTNLFTKKLDGTVYGIPSSEKKTGSYLEKLSQTLRADVYEDSIKNNLSEKDLNDLMSFALK